MSATQTTFALRQLREVSASAALSDGELLGRFLATRDEGAFEALVRRHGPLVLGVCRRLLRQRQDAEDAFQAAFLILARRAASIHSTQALGSWLYGVAYRVASKARARAAARARHEQRASTPAEADALGEVSGRELLAVLDGELNAMAARDREPLVLCYLEGRTRDEAAAQLGCSLSTLQRRLERGRERLRLRLARRGLGLPAALLGVGLTAAAVPEALAEGAVRGALDAPVARVAALAGAARPLGAGVLSAVGAALIALLGAGAVALSAGPEAAPTPAPAAAAQANAPTPQPALPPAKKDKNDLIIDGKVLDDAGKPLAGADVGVLMRRESGLRHIHRGEWPREVARAKTDGDGRFRLKLTAAELRGYHEDIGVYTYRPGHAFAVRREPHRPAEELVLRLPRERVLRGKVVDLQGQPAAGVRLSLLRAIEQVPADGKRPPTYARGADGPFWPAAVVSDSEGRFTVRGLAEGWSFTLHADGEGYALQRLDVTAEQVAAGKPVTLSLEPGKTLEGAITFEDSGKPVPAARVLIDCARGQFDTGPSETLEVRTDAGGRFRSRLYTGGFYSVLAYPPAGAPYLLRWTAVEWPAGGAVRQEVKLALPRGVVVRGAVTEQPSGKPVAGATVYPEPRYSDNPFFRRDVLPVRTDWRAFSVTDAAGRFEAVVLPGPGHLFINGPTSDYLHQERSTRELAGEDTFPNRRHYADAFVKLDHKPKSGPHEVKVVLRRGVTVAGRVVDPDGKPADGARLVAHTYIPYGYDLNPVHPLDVRGGRFELPGCDPAKPARVHFVDAKRQLGAVAEISGKDGAGEGPLVRLGPCGSAIVRFVDGKGKPVAGVRTLLQVVLRPGASFFGPVLKDNPLIADVAYMRSLDRERYADRDTGADGKQAFPTLIPGATYQLIGRRPDGGHFDTAKEFTVRPGQALDLGDVVVPERRMQNEE